MWQEALLGIRKYLVISTKESQLTTVAELPNGVGSALLPKMDHLVCFLPGTIALGPTGGLTEAKSRRLPTWSARKDQEMQLARELMKTCWAIYRVTETGPAPEIAFYNVDADSLQPHQATEPVLLPKCSNNMKVWKADHIIKTLDAHNLQRPETVESIFVMWRIAKDTTYRKWGWKIFKAFQKHALLGLGEEYTSLNDVNQIPPPRRDNMESFWLVTVDGIKSHYSFY